MIFILIFILIIPGILLIYEIVSGTLLLNRSSINKFSLKRKPCLILIPAHNEESIIQNTLIKLKKEIDVNDRILVIADNCNDDTKKICIDSAVDVIERYNTNEIGKSFALQYGVDYFQNTEQYKNIETIVIFDADCEFKIGSLETLLIESQKKNCITQSNYQMKATYNAKSKTKISEFTWFLKNSIRPAGLKTLGLGCHLQGSGMAFPREILKIVNFASGEIAEDLELGLSLAKQRIFINFVPHSYVFSFFPNNDHALETQRTRWEHGHVSLIANKIFPLLKASILSANYKAIFLAIDAAIPPLLIWLFYLSVGTVLLAVLNSTFAFYYFVFLLATITAIIFSWRLAGNEILNIHDIKAIFNFIGSKLNIYKRLFKSREKNWVKTKRDNE